MKLKNKKIIAEISLTNPFLKNHLVHGRSVLPGLAYIDMLFQIAQANGFDIHRTVLKKLSIYHPLTMGDDVGIELTISFTEMHGILKILIEGVTKKNDGTVELNRIKYVSAELQQAEAISFDKTIDVTEINNQSQPMAGMEEAVYTPARNHGLVHREIMKADGAVCRFQGDYIANLAIPFHYQEDAGSYLFHPTLLDGGAMAAIVAIQDALPEQKVREPQRLFLPIFFESFSASETMNTECYAKVSEIEFIHEIIYCNIEFYNRDGRQVGLLKRLTTKGVRPEEQVATAVPEKAPPVSNDSAMEIDPTLENWTNPIQAKVLNIFSRYLALDPAQLDLQQGFFDLGLESAHFLEIVRELETIFKTTLNPTLMFECSNIQELIAYLENTFSSLPPAPPASLARQAGKPDLLANRFEIPVALEEALYEFYDQEPYLQDHLVLGRPALMGITHPACVIEELLRRGESLPIRLDQLQFTGGPVTPGANDVIHVRVVCEPRNGQIRFRSEYYLNDAPTAKPCLTGWYLKPGDNPVGKIDLQVLLHQGQPMAASDLTAIYEAIPNFKIGAMLRTIEAAYIIDPTTMVTKVNLAGKTKKGNLDSFVFDPLALNSCYYSCILENVKKDALLVPLMIESLSVFRELTKLCYIITTVNKASRDYASFDSVIINDTGEIAAKVINASLKAVENPAMLANAVFDNRRESLPAVNTDAVDSKANGNDIAVIGLSGRYPQARNLREFWQNLRDGKDCITEIPKERWDHSLYYTEDKNEPGKTYSKWGGFLEGADQFDPLFFNISPREAEVMDPQERLFLECVFETLEDAGYTREGLKSYGSGGRVGVFVGVMNEEYQLYGAQAQANGVPLTLSGNPSSIANRISYFCNFHGPSMALDTMCSSSLTAIHLACRSIRQGECQLAIAGGVNLILHPNKYLLLAQGKFVSSKGRCESFGQGGDGYVPGEGIGSILLKPLAKAIADGDHIYGVIKGTAINHGGKTSGYTVPNPNAQAEVVHEAFAAAGVDPRSISYVEAHGTGTSLGDPIEIAGLVKAFGEYATEHRFCALGSVKSNIGHCESAAGIAGVTKVLLQLQHRQLVPSLHSTVLNSNIDFNHTPFTVQQELAEWERPVLEIDGITGECPRIAGISSFGAGGSNAHLVIAEYIPEIPEGPFRVVTSGSPALIVLSAKNKERLNEQAQRLLLEIRSRRFTDHDLADMAYTLQTGREAMEERIGIITGSIAELTEKLSAFAAGETGIDGLFQGQVKRNQEELTIFTADEELQEAVGKWIARRKYQKLLGFWVRGLAFDWNRIYDGAKPRRISLPVYPFATERYWIPQPEKIGTKNAGDYIRTAIHPLLQQNTSDLSEQRYSSTFSGREFFLTDHRLNGEKVLPGVAYLEMARAAIDEALGKQALNRKVLKLNRVVWTRPLRVAEDPREIHIGLYPEDSVLSKDGGEITFEIYGPAGGEGAGRVIYSQGRGLLGEVTEIPTIDLLALQAECDRRQVPGAEIYHLFKTIGFDYGPGHRGIETLYAGRDLVLAKLALPSAVAGTEGEFVLHPSIMDAALQASIGMMIGEANGDITPRPALPFALQELEVYDRCQAGMWAILRYSQGSRGTDKVQKLDIDICDEQGHVCVRLKGFSAKTPETEARIIPSATTTGYMLLEPVWKPQTAINTVPEIIDSGYSERLVILCEPGAVPPESLTGGLNGAGVLRLQSNEASIAKRYQAYAVRILEALQEILAEKPADQVLVQLVLANWNEQQLLAGLAGILKTAQLENSRLIGQVIEVEAMDDPELLIATLKDDGCRPKDSHIRYRQGQRQVIGWAEVAASSETADMPWKDRGVYLISGGAGGLGLIFAKEIAERVKDASLILTGRSGLSEAKGRQLKELAAAGTRIEYRSVDVSDPNAVNELIGSIQTEFGALNGIIHSAGVIRDSYLIMKTKEELIEVLTPKVTGLVNLDQASKDINLDFMILCSSMAGCLGNPGQADYSAANAFMDAYAGYRNQLVSSGQRHGRTVSFNWPLWREGGMRPNATVEKIMQESTGMSAMRTSTGIRALYEGAASGRSQVMVVEGDLSLIRRKLFAVEPAAAVHEERNAAGAVIPAGYETGSLREKIQDALIQEVSHLLKVKIEDLETDTELSEYGFDSIGFTQFSDLLNRKYRLDLTPTIFFEYPTLCGFSEYLAQEHQELLAAQFSAQTTIQTPRTVAEDMGTESPVIHRPTRSRFVETGLIAPATSGTVASEIAIVGMSGIFPQARNLEEFWDNLATAKDCITEIPKDRWDWLEYYGDPIREVNKTNIKWGGFIEGIAEFDPLFFGISPREAELMDPQQRLLMTYVWKAIEDAGYSAESLSGTKTGIFIGTAGSGYDELIAKADLPIEAFSATGLVASVGPNRMSYFLNIHGPSEPVETACSSSLVAIHRAVSAIETGSCEMAIVGGINTILTPESHISFSKAGMLCEDGRCKTFSDKANGYVRGEGAGILFLKKLAEAEQAGDHIYGIIRGTAENHGGRANSLTAPNPKAQAELLQTAYRKAGIDPRTVTYIEAHGTGTELGDPVEINGLKMAFKELYQMTGDPAVFNSHCGLGTVKTNIGHLELASGAAGVIKVLLQLQHRTLVKSLHCETINPYIQLKDSPFYLVREKKAWERLRDDRGREIPRRAGVSSFGFGGVNAHVVIEEYIPQTQRPSALFINSQNPALIVLSAKTGAQLKECAGQLAAAIRDREFSDEDLADIAYTLQVGREAMEERLGMIAGSIRELAEQLGSFLEGRDDAVALYRGRIKRDKRTMAVFTMDEDMAQTVAAWIGKRKYGKLLDLWVNGLAFDWNTIYGATKPRRMSLPTYPFAKERYWVEENTRRKKTEIHHGVSWPVHPLLQQNNSDLTEQRYSSTFDGKEFFVTGYTVNGQKAFPGMAYLEMARAAVETAAVAMIDKKQGIKLRNIVWTRLLKAGEPVQVHIRLYPETDGKIAYEIYGLENSESAAVLYNRGSAILAERTGELVLNLTGLQAECNQRMLTGAKIYELYKAIGLDYGPGYQAIETIQAGRETALAKLTLPSFMADTVDQFVLHPVIMAAALQASIGLAAGEPDRNTITRFALPFTLQELEIYNRCQSSMWAVIRYGAETGAADRLSKLDMDLCDEQGQVCVRLKGFSSRAPEIAEDVTGSTIATGNILLEPVWKAQSATNAGQEPNVPGYLQRWVILCEPGTVSPESIADGLNGATVLSLQSNRKNIAQRYQAYAVQLLEAVRKILAEQPTGPVLVQLVTTELEEQQLFKGLAGILKTAQLENPKLIGQLIELEAMEEPEALNAILTENSCRMEGHIRYRQGQRQVAGWAEVATPPEVSAIPWKDKGVYLITGGAGGLGLIFAQEIAERVKDACLILTGRSSLSEAKQTRLRELESVGVRVEYRMVDVGDKNAVHELIESIHGEFGNLDGIIHSAGVIRDNYIIKKTEAELIEVMTPKVTGLVNLDRASKDMNLDFMIFCSSIAGAFGNPGQADYAAANAFMDAYAGYRNQLVSSGRRQGRTVSFNWPLWQEGGMRPDPESQQLMIQTSGLIPMKTETGIQALYRGMRSGKDQLMTLEGDLQKFQNRFLHKPTAVHIAKTGSEGSVPRRGRRPELKGLSVAQCLEWDLKNLIYQILRIPRDRIDRDQNLAEFGFNSLNLNQLAIQLIKKYGISITPALFFNYSTVEKLAQYYLGEHEDTIREYYREESSGTDSPDTPAGTVLGSGGPEAKAMPKFRFMKRDQDSGVLEPIAVIGMSGRFPGARNIDELWSVLAAGQDMVREIPADRFDWRQYYGDPATEPGKTNCKWCGCISGVREFDPLFFEISPREAETMDPRQRLLLQESWKALEDAGYGPNQIKAQKIGIFAGVEQGDYQILTGGAGDVCSNNNAILAARLAYFLNLNGPVMAIDTACSSGLVAAHQAISSIRTGDCDTAIVAGANLLLTPVMFTGMSQSGMLSGDGKCFAFDRRANGMVPGEAVAAIVFKRLSRAEADGDPIYAVIKGSGINYDGKTNGITAPSGVSQTALLKAVYDQYRIHPEDIGYIVTHGTGTPLGDPIEINALDDTFKGYTQKQGYCAITSTKTNFGHCFGSSGLVSLISLVQAIRHRTIPASLHCEQASDYINWRESPFYVNKAAQPWPDQNGILTGAVSAFGMSGTNAHMVVQSYNRDEAPARSELFRETVPCYLLAFSAKTPEALTEKIRDMLIYFENNGVNGENLSCISFTLLEGRHHFNYRCAMVVQDREQAVSVFTQFLNREPTPNVLQGKTPQEFTGRMAIAEYGQDLLKQSRSWSGDRAKYRETLFALADLYCQGYRLNWPLLFGEFQPERIHLPAYPFAKELYWLPQLDLNPGPQRPAEPNRPSFYENEAVSPAPHPVPYQNTSADAGVQADLVAKAEADYELLTFEEVWQKAALPDRETGSNPGFKLNRVVCYLSDPGNQECLRATLQSFDRQTELIFIAQGMTYQKYSARNYDICKTDSNTYREAFRSIMADGLKEPRSGEISTILYLWPLEDSGCIGDYSGIVRLMQAMAETKLMARRLLFAAQFGSDSLDRCYAESWIGFERSLRMVLPDLRIAAIYQGISPETRSVDMGDWGRKIWAELQNPTAQTVLYQDNDRLVYQIRPTDLQPGASMLKPGGTYLITGGCGGIGRLLAQHLAKLSRETEPVKLILTGRSPLDEEKQSQIRALEALGSQAIYVQADVSDTAAMRDGLDQAVKRFGQIHGVIHAAGVNGTQLIFDSDLQSFLKVLEPKIQGALVLDELFRTEPLDFTCYFSSTSAIIGDFGSCNYAIANRFLMAYADYRNRSQIKGAIHGKTVVINWPLWREGGMGFGDAENTRIYLKSSGQRFLETGEGLALFERLLAQDSAQHVVFAGQPQAVRRFLGLTPEPAAALAPTGSLEESPGRMRGRRPEMKGMSLEQCLEWDLKWLVNRLLKIPPEKIDSAKNLAEFGFNSLGLTQLAIQLVKHFGIRELTPALFFKYPTIEKFNQFLLTEYQSVMQEFYREETGVLEAVKSPEPPKVEVQSKPQLPSPTFAARSASDGLPGALEPVAVIGMSGRFPKADTVAEFWDRLINGESCITEIPQERWDWREYYGDPQSEPGKTNSKWGGFIAGIDQFDPAFFEMSPQEAVYLDPKQRLFLEESWHCLEDAGYMGERICGKRCGVYAGVEEGEYGFISGGGGGLINSNQNAALPARIAYKLDLKGPNLAITASCSSGLAAIHQACQALRQGDCELALAGGINLMITPMIHAGLGQAGMLSPDGRCYVFDRRANGMAPGEAVAVVLLKPLSKAVADRDYIYGCIKASGVNYNGKGNGISAPNPLSQAELLHDIYTKYHINPESIQYVIPQSLGSKLGDPLEFQVLAETFAQYTAKKQYCAISSVKPLIGHTFAASGVVSLIAMLLAMKHRRIFAMHNFETSNEYIDFANSPFRLNRKNQAWETPDNQPRTGAISTTGTNGTNAHAVIEEYLSGEEAPLDTGVTTSAQIVILSAKNQERLEAAVRQLLAFIGKHSQISLPDMAYTLQVGREPMGTRLATVAGNRQELIDSLQAYLDSGGAKQTGITPYYNGDPEHDPAEMGELFSGKVAGVIVETFLQERKLDKLAHYWAKGGKIPWESLHVGESVHRIPIPTYPFARERYWAPDSSRLKSIREIPTPGLKVAIEPEAPVQTGRETAGPRNEVERALVEVFGEVLHTPNIGIEDNFFRLGGNSTAVVQALELIGEKLGQKVSVKDIYTYNTIAELAQVIQEGRGTDEVIDLNREAVLDEAILPCGNITAPADCSKILLTGGTGFVGRFLLYELLQNTEATIYCMVRAGSKAEALKRIQTGLREFDLWEPGYGRRIVAVAGDLSRPELGMAQRTYRSLANTIEVIYHCATYMNHLATYREMKNTTVEGVQRILRFACDGKQKLIHYISTLSVFNGNQSRPIYETSPIEGEVHYNSAGYAAGKWVADKLMMLAWERGIPANIYRLGLVTGDSQQGRADKAQSFYRFLQTYLEMGCYGQHVSGYQTALTPVDFVAKAVVYLARRPETNRIYHLTNPQRIEMLDLIKAYNAGAEKPLAIVPMFEFFNRIKESLNRGQMPPVVPIIRDLLELSEAELQSLDWNSRAMDLYACRDIDPGWTLGVLREGGILLPEVDGVLMKKYFEYIAERRTDGGGAGADSGDPAAGH